MYYNRYMKKITIFIVIVLGIVSCKGVYTSNSGDFILKNNSENVIQFVWLAPVGEFYPTAKEVSIAKSGIYELKGLKAGVYDIAIDFFGQFNTFNSKKNPAYRLKVEAGVTSIWIIDEAGNVVVQ